MGDWSIDHITDLEGRSVIVTGANTGIGFEASRIFAEHGAFVIMACRILERGEAARADILDTGPDGEVAVRELDLADLSSIRSFAESVDDDLQVLCNNAGVMAIPRRETADGFEYQFGVNHLGHFALTGLLLEQVTAAAGESRIVTQSSGVHERGTIDFTDLQHERSYDKWSAYAQSKLANVLFAYELDRRLRAHGIGDVTSVACHPGYADTDLQRRGPEAMGSTVRLWGIKLANALLAQSPSRGALPMLYAATGDDIEGGDYLGPGGLLNMRGAPEKQRSSDRSYDEVTADRLWTVSEQLTDVSYDFGALTTP